MKVNDDIVEDKGELALISGSRSLGMHVKKDIKFPRPS